MQIQINTDRNIDGNEDLVVAATDTVAHALRRFSEEITRVEVHLADENGPKTGGTDIRCMMEARIAGRQPIAVTHNAGTIPIAIEGAARSLVSLIENTLGRTEALRRAARE